MCINILVIILKVAEVIKIFLHTIIVRFFLICAALLFAIPFAIISLLPQNWLYKSKFFYWMIYSLSRFTVVCSFLPITWEGVQHIPHEPSIIIANHQSSLDIPIVGSLLGPHRQIWLATTYLLRSRLYRILLPKFVVWVDSSKPICAARSLMKIIKLAKMYKQHIIIFPEGGRFTDGSVHDFFAGFATLARKMGRPVVPIFISGINKVYPPDSFWITKYPVTATVGKSFHIEHQETDIQFRDRILSWFRKKNQQK